MIDLIRESGGAGLPSAEMIAERAGVGLRTVFRLFEDMDGVYRGMQAVLHEQFAHMLDQPPVSGDWRADLRGELARRAELYEFMLPLQIAADAQRHRSPALREGRARLVSVLRERLMAILPADSRANGLRFAGVELALSFEAWRRLRTDQEASAEAAREAMDWIAFTLLDGASG